MAEWDESSRNMTDFADVERTSADHFAASDESEFGNQHIAAFHKDPNSQPYPTMEDEEGADSFARDPTHSSQDEYSSSQIVPDLDRGVFCYESQDGSQEDSNMLHGDPHDLPANFTREPAKNEQFQQMYTEDDLEYHDGDHIGASDEGMGHYDNQQPHESCAEGANPFDVADGLLAQKGVAADEAGYPSPFSEQDQSSPTLHQDDQVSYGEYDHDRISAEEETTAREMVEERQQLTPEMMAAFTQEEPRYDDDDDEDEDSDTENAHDDFDYGKMEEEDVSEEIPKDESDAREAPVVGIDNQAFEDQEEAAGDEFGRIREHTEMRKESEDCHPEEIEQKPDSTIFQTSEPDSGYEMAAGPVTGEEEERLEFQETHKDELSDKHGVMEGQYDEERGQSSEDSEMEDVNIPEIPVCEPCGQYESVEESTFERNQNEEQFMSQGLIQEESPEPEPPRTTQEEINIPEIPVCEPCDQYEAVEETTFERNENEEQFISQGLTREESPEPQPPGTTHDFPSGMETESGDDVRDSAEIFSKEEFQEPIIDPTQSILQHCNQFGDESRIGELEEKTEKNQYEEVEETPVDDSIEPDAVSAQFSQPGFVDDAYHPRDDICDHQQDVNVFDVEKQNQETGNESSNFEIERDLQTGNNFDEGSQEFYSQNQEFTQYTDTTGMEISDARKPAYDEPGSYQDHVDSVREKEEGEYAEEEEKPVDDVIESDAVGAQFSQPGFDDEAYQPSGNTYDDQHERNVFDNEKQEQEIVKESSTFEDEGELQSSNQFEEERRELPTQDQEFSQYTDNIITADVTSEEGKPVYTDNEGLGSYQDHLDGVREEVDQSVHDDQSHAIPPSSFGELDPVMSSHEEKKSFVDNLDELASPETIPQPLPSPPEPRTISNFDPLVPDSTSSSPPRSPSFENHESYGQSEERSEAQYQNEVMNDVQSETADFLTAGEVEGETKFGVDGSAVTKSASQNNQFLTSEDEEDESPQMDDEFGRPEDLTTAATTETTTETETSEKSGDLDSNSVEPGTFDQIDNVAHDNALMSMSMEGSFYDDGGDLIGGDDNHVDKDTGNVMYQSAITEESEPSCSISPHRESVLHHEQQFIQQQTDKETREENVQEQNGLQAKEDDLYDQQQIPISHESSTAPIPSGFGDIVSNANTFEQEEEKEQQINGSEDSQGDFNSLLDAPVIETGLQTPVTDSSSTAFESSVDVHDTHNQVPIGSREIESDVDHMNAAQHEPINGFAQAVAEEMTRDAVEKVESAGASTVSVPEPVEQKEVADTASAQLPEPVSVPDAAAAAAVVPEAKTTAKSTEEKKKPKKAPGTTTTSTAKKTTTTTTSTGAKKSTTTASASKTMTPTTTTTAKTTRVSSARTSTTSATKKTEMPSTTRQTSPTKKPTEAKTTTADKKTPRPASSPTKAPSKSSPLPSYAQPITPRKPREAKLPAEGTKRPATASPRPTSSTAPKTRPASATTRTITSTTSRTTATTATTTSTTRPKSSPTKLANGSLTERTTSPTKRTTTGLAAKPAGEKKDVKPTPSRGTASPATGAARSPQKTASPRTPPTSSATKSKIGSLNNATHTPGGGNVKITTKKVDYSNVTSRVGSKDKMDHKPGGGHVKIESRKVKTDTVQSRVGSMDNAKHKPAGGDKKIESKKLEWKVESRIGSLDNARHVAGGGDKKIEDRKLEWAVTSKIGSLDNAKHVPGGGDKKIETRKTEWSTKSKIGSLDNASHTPGGGTRKIETQKTEWHAQSKIGSMDNVKHQPGGGEKKIESQANGGSPV